MTTAHQQGRQLNRQVKREKKQEAREGGFTTSLFLKLAAFQKGYPRFSTIGWRDFWEYIESRLTGGGLWKSAEHYQKKGRGGPLTLVYNLSIWRAEPAVMKGENVLDGDGDREGERGDFLEDRKSIQCASKHALAADRFHKESCGKGNVWNMDWTVPWQHKEQTHRLRNIPYFLI